MTSSAPFRRFAFAFGTTFAILYVVALARDVALFTVFPSLGVVLAGTHHTRDVADPAMGYDRVRLSHTSLVSVLTGRDFRIGSKAALTAPKSNFRLTPESGLRSDIAPCPKSAHIRTFQ